MILKNLIKNLSTKKVDGNLGLKVRGISYNSQKVKKNDLFVAISGFRQDGHKYIREAIRKGACAIVAERNGDYQAPAKILVPNSRLSLAQLSNRFFNYPSQKLRVVGVT
ncbi:MAG: Mur ligase domain-containing protein, partial [candidate division Zixibacteria bacterium]|nr:Mur ligase domain-containing protein [candidate division Zixibacteria bacterium]